METIIVSKATALEIYGTGSKKVKAALEDLCGKNKLIGSIMDHITSFEAALEYNGETMEQFNHRTQFDSPTEKADKKCAVYALALNEGRVMELGEERWYPVFRGTGEPGSGSGFSFGGSGFDRAYSLVGARLTFKSKALSDYAGKMFTNDYYQARK